MLKFCVFSLPVLFASLFSFFGGKEDPYEKNEARMNSIVNHSIKQLTNRYGLKPVGRGGGVTDNKSRREYVAFHLNHKLTKEEARILLVEVVELVLHNINSDNEITHHLYDNPFTYRNLEFRIFIYDKDHSDIFYPDLGLVTLTRRGTVTFVTYAEGELCSRATDEEEPYEETYRLATQGSSNALQN